VAVGFTSFTGSQSKGDANTRAQYAYYTGYSPNNRTQCILPRDSDGLHMASWCSGLHPRAGGLVFPGLCHIRRRVLPANLPALKLYGESCYCALPAFLQGRALS